MFTRTPSLLSFLPRDLISKQGVFLSGLRYHGVSISVFILLRSQKETRETKI